jgi:hypothetical protein
MGLGVRYDTGAKIKLQLIKYFEASLVFVGNQECD